MQKADYLLQLMKQRTDALVATDEKLQQFLMRIEKQKDSRSGGKLTVKLGLSK